jgi:hypothetical protein
MLIVSVAGKGPFQWSTFSFSSTLSLSLPSLKTIVAMAPITFSSPLYLRNTFSGLTFSRGSFVQGLG